MGAPGQGWAAPSSTPCHCVAIPDHTSCAKPQACGLAQWPAAVVPPAVCLEDDEFGPLLTTTMAQTPTRTAGLLPATPCSLPGRSRECSSLPASSSFMSRPTCCLRSSFWVSSSCCGIFPTGSMVLAKMGGGEAWTFRASSSACRGRGGAGRGGQSKVLCPWHLQRVMGTCPAREAGIAGQEQEALQTLPSPLS